MKIIQTLIFSLSFVFLSASLFAQSPTKSPKLIGKLSIDQALSGTGDMRLTRMENALEYRLNRYFTPSVSLAFAKSDLGVHLTTSMIQSNANMFFSPFRNNRNNDFRIGIGVSGMRVSNFFEKAAFYENGQYAYSEYEFRQENTYGFNLILEDNFQLSPHILLGFRLAYQLYESGDQIIGGGINLGIQI